MAVWMVRILDGKEPAAVGSSRFSDVDVLHWWAAHVERFAELGVTKGYTDGTFRPYRHASRAQMAAFLTRAFDLDAAGDAGFSDTEGNTHYEAINALAASGITRGYADGTFRPDRHVTRAQMAAFISRALDTVVFPPSRRFSEVAAGGGHACGLRTEGTVVCWGNNDTGQADAPDGQFDAVAAGSEHTCALRTEGTVVCWGNNYAGQAEDPDGQFSAVSAGGWHSCGLRTDSTVVCWGADWDGQAAAPSGRFSTVAAGDRHSCGLRTDATVECWGADGDGQATAPGGSFSSVSAGRSHSCGVRADATVECWGADRDGRTTAPHGQFSAVSAGGDHSCGVRADGTVECWGADRHGQAAAPSGRFSTVAAGDRHSCGLRAEARILCWGIHEAGNEFGQLIALGGQFSTISAGFFHSCGVRADGTVECWGADWDGRTTAPHGQFSAVSAGDEHSCGVRADGTVECWGADGDGQATAPGGSFSSVSAGRSHSCGVRADGTVECWGADGDGQATAPGGSFSSVFAGGSHSCGVRADATVECWGADWDGRTTAPHGQFSAVSAGGGHSCGVRADSTVVCWGADWDGQAAAPSGRFSTVAAGDRHSCGVRESGAVVCWGYGGRLGDAPEGRFESVTVGGRPTCGLRSDSSVACWSFKQAVPPPYGVHRHRPRDHPDPTRCRPQGVEHVTAGFPLPGYAASATGTLRVAVLFVDFPNAVASHTTLQEAALGLPDAEETLESSSYGRLDVEFTALHEWLRTEHDYEHYLADSVIGAKHLEFAINEEAIRLADPGFDFTGHDIAMIVMPSSHFGGGNATGRVDTQEGPLDTTRINAFPWEDPVEPQLWGGAAAHELVHNLGLLDMYPYDASRGELPEAPAAKMWVTSGFGMMGLHSFFLADEEDRRLASVARFADGGSETYYTAEVGAGEMLAWSRWQLGWLDASQIRCIITPEATVSLSPVAAAGNEVAMAAVPLSDTEVIVIESRRKIGYDAPFEQAHLDTTWTGPALVSEGVLVYTVDAHVDTGQLPLKVAGDAGNGQVHDYPILTAGDSVTVRGYTIAVVSDDGATHTVTITKTPDG